ncbi:MAG: DNA polymerase III subunit beta [Bacteroidetes bacterium HGW-Bacteroidetes-21]|nr:MAG: DNA polymerase III subunit beta [Bacteroidetes bacterium HGW-Bacteroidetes-21]
MNFVISSSDLLSRLQMVSRVIASKNTIPILDDFLFEISGKNLIIKASDLETTIVCKMQLINVDGEGHIAVDARRLVEILKEFSEQPLTFMVDFNNLSVEIQSQHGKYSLTGHNADDFPKTPALKKAEMQEIKITSELFLSGVSMTHFATANDELRPAMNGIYIEADSNAITFVATDAQKLVRYMRKDVTITGSAGFILPKKPSALLRNVLQKFEGEIMLQIDKNNASFKIGEYSIICRLVDANYPAYNSVIPKQNPNKLTVDRVEFYNTLKRVSVFANAATNLIRLEISGNNVRISAEDLDNSLSAYENVPCQYEGDPIVIGFRSVYFLELLSNLSSTEIRIEMSEPNRAGLIFPNETENEQEEILMLLMPMMLMS